MAFTMESVRSMDLRSRVRERIAAWQIVVESITETESSVLAFGRRHDQPVVLKVVRNPADEWRSGTILEAFGGRGTVRVYEHVEGAILLERLSPGGSLVSLVLSGADDEATAVLVQTIAAMSSDTVGNAVATVKEWGTGFDRYLASGDRHVPNDLLAEAHQVYSELCESQTRVRLLHGDLHHYNVLFDARRGWLAVDPKGVVGELEYEVGAALRNPYERPDLFAEPAIIRKRVDRFARELHLDATRVLAWAFAQAVLSAVWAVEDGFAIEPGDAWITLARTIQPLLGGR